MVNDPTTDVTWWNADKRERKSHDYLVPKIRQMRSQQSTLYENTKKCIAIFQWGGDGRAMGDTDDPPLEDTCVSFNAAQNLVETVQAKVCKTRIEPMALTSGGGPGGGGGFLARFKAKQLTRGVLGEFAANETDEIIEDVVTDALATAHGAGAAKVFDDDGKVCIQHVPIEDILFDRSEIRRRSPRSMYQTDRIDKYVCAEKYGDTDEKRAAILKAGILATAQARVRGHESDDDCQIEIFEAWHLPSGDVEYDVEIDDEGDESKPRAAKHDGRHVVAIEGCTLVDEPWDCDWFPFVLYVPRKRRRSIWGLSLMFDLVAPQREYEKMSKKFQETHQRMGVSGFLSPKGAQLNQREIQAGTAAAGWVAEYEGNQPPTPLIIDPVPPGAYAYQESIPRQMSERKGISSLSASSQLPAGMGDASGKALQVFEDFESERLLPYHRNLERFVIGLTKLVIRTAAAIVDERGSYTVKAKDDKGRTWAPLDWKEILVDIENLIIDVFPVSTLSRQPSARFAQLTELLNAQAITSEQFKRLYGLPDLDAELEIDTADTDIIDRNLDIIVTTGRYLAPQPFDDLKLAIARAGKFYNLCRQYEVPEARLKLVSDYIADAKQLSEEAEAEAIAKQRAQQQAQQPPPGQGGPPMAAAA